MDDVSLPQLRERLALSLANMKSDPILSPISTKDEEWIRAEFNKIDKDHDGKLNVREILLALRNDSELASKLSLPMHVKQEDGSRDAFEKVFQTMDTDGLRLIDFKHFHDYVLDHLGSTTNNRASADEKKQSDTLIATVEETITHRMQEEIARSEPEYTERSHEADDASNCLPSRSRFLQITL